jgi:hypothetical protein
MNAKLETQMAVCDNCQWEGSNFLPLGECPDLHERLDPGAEVPAGDCPECDCFCYLTDDGWGVKAARLQEINSDLLAALEGIVSARDNAALADDPAYYMIDREINAARKAIAKAKAK